MSRSDLWHNRNYRLILGASTISHPGAGVSGVKFGWFATVLTLDPFLIGLVARALDQDDV